MDAVNSSPASALDFQLADSTRRQAYAARFQSRRNSPFGNVVGELDGIAVEQEQPLASDVTCVADNNFLEGFYAFNVQAICDAEYKFRWMSCKSPGAMYDSAAFTCTSLGQFLSRPHDPLTSSLIRDGQCIAANETYAASEVLGVPWPGAGKGDLWRDAYNFYVVIFAYSHRAGFWDAGVAVGCVLETNSCAVCEAAESHSRLLPSPQLLPRPRHRWNQL